MLPIYHGHPARPVAYYLKQRERWRIVLRLELSGFALCELPLIAMTV
jgi:hypothetical protein